MIEGVPIVPYDPAFLGGGHQVPLPTPVRTAAADAYRGGEAVPYLHYSLVLNELRSLAIFVAINFDRERWIDVQRGQDQWLVDSRLPLAIQRENSLYTRNDWDRGHLASRQFINWADSAVSDTTAYKRAAFFYAATAPQHANFNRVVWSGLERYLHFEWAPHADRLAVFIGPVFRVDDPLYRSTRIPRTFWAVAVAVHPENQALLTVRAFAIDQLAVDESGVPVLGQDGSPVALDRQEFVPDRLTIPLRELSELVDLDFGFLEQYDEVPR